MQSFDKDTNIQAIINGFKCTLSLIQFLLKYKIHRIYIHTYIYPTFIHKNLSDSLKLLWRLNVGLCNEHEWIIESTKAFAPSGFDETKRGGREPPTVRMSRSSGLSVDKEPGQP